MRAMGMSVDYIDENVQFMISMATNVPFLGRG